MADEDAPLFLGLSEAEVQEILLNARPYIAFNSFMWGIRLDTARSILYRVLAARSLRVTPKMRARIDGPDVSLDQLETWIVAGIDAGTAGQVFRDKPVSSRRRTRQRPRNRRA